MTATIGRRPMTKRQRAVFTFIVKYRLDHGFSPTVDDICQQFGFASKNGAMSHLHPLRAKGWITWEPNCARTILPVEGDA